VGGAYGVLEKRGTWGVLEMRDLGEAWESTCILTKEYICVHVFCSVYVYTLQSALTPTCRTYDHGIRLSIDTQFYHFR
jgi:hypothetical protein